MQQIPSSIVVLEKLLDYQLIRNPRLLWNLKVYYSIQRYATGPCPEAVD
jgi:hypothetical protein